MAFNFLDILSKSFNVFFSSCIFNSFNQFLQRISSRHCPYSLVDLKTIQIAHEDECQLKTQPRVFHFRLFQFEPNRLDFITWLICFHFRNENESNYRFRWLLLAQSQSSKEDMKWNFLICISIGSGRQRYYCDSFAKWNFLFVSIIILSIAQSNKITSHHIMSET